MNSILDIACMQDYIRTCEAGWQQGWHERNGGNLTYRMTREEAALAAPFFAYDRPYVRMGVRAPHLAGEHFIATGSGKYFQNVARCPQENLCIVQINEEGDAFRIVWGLTKGGRPTSEFESHFMNHAVRVRATDVACRVIYHAHPAHVIALTYVLPLTSREIGRASCRERV